MRSTVLRHQKLHTYPPLAENTLPETILPNLNDILVTVSPKFKDNLKSIALMSSIKYQ